MAATSIYEQFFLLFLHANILPALGYVYIGDNPKDLTVFVGSNAKFTCDVSTGVEDKGRTQIRWKFNDSVIDKSSKKYSLDQSGRKLIVRKVSRSDAGSYLCIASVGLDQDMKSAKLSIQDKPKPPANVQIMNCMAQSAEILWEPGSDATDITEYKILYNRLSEPNRWYEYEDNIPAKSRMTVVNLLPWGKYSFKVVSRNSLGYSIPSRATMKRCETTPDRPFTNPSNVHTDTSQKGKLIIVWTPMEERFHNGPGFGYKISWRLHGAIHWNVIVDKNSSNGRTEIAVDTVYELYDMKVQATNNMADSSQPPYVKQGRSGEAEPVVIPSDFRLDPNIPVTATSAAFIWEAVNTNLNVIRGHFRGYRIRYWKSIDGRQRLKEIDIEVNKRHGPDVRAVLTDLPPYTDLRAQVTAINNHYSSLPSSIVSFKTAEGVPGPVRNLRVVEEGNDYVTLEWQRPFHPNGVIKAYDIGYQSGSSYSSMSDVTNINPSIKNPSIRSVKIRSLRPEMHYRFYIWARTRVGRGETSVIDFTGFENELEKGPEAPRVKIVDVGKTFINVTWVPASNRDTIEFLLHYRRVGTRKWTKSKLLRQKNWRVLRKLRPGTSYKIRVVVKPPSGEISSSKVLHIKTKGSRETRYRFPGHSSSPRQPSVTSSTYLITLTLYLVFRHTSLTST